MISALRTRHVIVPPGEGPQYRWREVWHARELLFALVERVWKVRYKQTVIGAAWAIIQPVVLMVVFTLFFGLLVRVPSDGMPYPVFVYCGLMVWQFFYKAFSDASKSIVENAHIVTKIFFPRILFPVAAVLAGLPDLGFALVALAGLMAFYGLVPDLAFFLVPLFIALTAVTALGAGLWFSAVYVRYRDVAQILPFTIQVWMFCTPIIYPPSLIPERFRLLYDLNPMVGVVEGIRWALVGSPPPAIDTLVVGTFTAMILLVSGVLFFRSQEPRFAESV